MTKVHNFNYLKPFDFDIHSATCLDSIKNYIGGEINGYVFYIKPNGADITVESNWLFAVDFLKELDVNYEVITLSHWLVGYVDYLLVDFDNSYEILNQLDDKLSELENYPLFDDDYLHSLELEIYENFLDDEVYGMSHFLLKELEYSGFDTELIKDDILDYWFKFLDSEYCHYGYYIDSNCAVTVEYDSFVEFMQNTSLVTTNS
jgi:hypothetical protein